MDDDIKTSLIPKMTLQPLVENAIYHGLKNKAGSGKIYVTGKTVSAESDGTSNQMFAEIRVVDDGIGMNSEEVEILSGLLDSEDVENEDYQLKEEARVTNHDSTKGGSHFGLYSVGRRIKLYFGKEYGASIISKEGEGTTVIVRVPYSSQVKNFI